MSNLFLEFLHWTPSRAIRALYPLLFWIIFLRLIQQMGISSIPIFSGLLSYFWFVLEILALVIVAFYCLLVLIFSIWTSNSYVTIQNNIPGFLKAFLKNPSPGTEATFKAEVRDLLIAARSTVTLIFLGLASSIPTHLSRHRKTAILSQIAFLVQLLALAVLTVVVSNYLSAQFGPLVVNTAWYDFSSPVISITLLAAFSIVDFGIEIEEVRNPIWKKVGTSTLRVDNFLFEFTLLDRVMEIVDYSVWKIRFGNDFASNIECPDNRTLTKIFGRALNNHIGPSLLFSYRYEELFPQKLLKGLAKFTKVRELIRFYSPVSYVGMDKDRKSCVLIATIYKSRDRRMSLWTGSTAMTRNIVTACTNYDRDVLGMYGAR